MSKRSVDYRLRRTMELIAEHSIILLRVEVRDYTVASSLLGLRILLQLRVMLPGLRIRLIDAFLTEL